MLRAVHFLTRGGPRLPSALYEASSEGPLRLDPPSRGRKREFHGSNRHDSASRVTGRPFSVSERHDPASRHLEDSFPASEGSEWRDPARRGSEGKFTRQGNFWKLKQERYRKHISDLVRKSRQAEAVKLLEQMKKGRVRPDEVTYNTVLSGYAKHGDAKMAFKLFNEVGFSFCCACAGRQIFADLGD